MMLHISMEKGIGPHGKCQGNHSPFKEGIVNDVDAKQGKGSEDQRQ